jgi:hypothetical protein
MSRPARQPRHVVRALAASIVAILALSGCAGDDEGEPAAPTMELTEVNPGAGDETARSRSDDSSSSSSSSTTTAPPDDGPIDLGPMPELSDVEQTYADAVVDSFEAEDGDHGAFFPDADVECMAVRWVALIGEDALVAGGMSPEGFGNDGPAEMGIDRATAEEMVRILEGCGGDLEVFYEAFAAGYTGSDDEDPGDAAAELLECMREAVPVADLREAMITSFMGDDDAGMDAIGDRWLDCAPTET